MWRRVPRIARITRRGRSQRVCTPKDLSSELMSRKREFNLSHVEKLCAYFGLKPSAFIKVPKDAGVIVSR